MGIVNKFLLCCSVAAGQNGFAVWQAQFCIQKGSRHQRASVGELGKPCVSKSLQLLRSRKNTSRVAVFNSLGSIGGHSKQVFDLL